MVKVSEEWSDLYEINQIGCWFQWTSNSWQFYAFLNSILIEGKNNCIYFPSDNLDSNFYLILVQIKYQKEKGRGMGKLLLTLFDNSSNQNHGFSNLIKTLPRNSLIAAIEQIKSGWWF